MSFPPPPSLPPHQSLDSHYIAKYKDMKRKLKEIELHNDRLHLKCLKARKNIQRLRLERSILYDRLSTISAPDSNVSPVVGAPPDPVHAQERYQHYVFPHSDQYHMRPEALHHPRSQHPHPPMGPGVLLFEPPRPPSKTRQRKSRLDLQGQASPPSTSHQEVCNGGSRTFPFVHEYTSAGESVLPPPEYPSEIRFHQYEAEPERRPVHRSRRDDAEKGSKHKRRPPQDVEQHHPTPSSLSPTGDKSPRVQTRSLQGDERDRRHDQAGAKDTYVHEWQADPEKPRDRLPPEKKNKRSQMDRHGTLHVRGVDVYSLPRVREGEVMD